MTRRTPSPRYTPDEHGTLHGPAMVEPVEATFECGCAASNVEWVRDMWNPSAYDHRPWVADGVRLCPVHAKPVVSR